MVAVTRPGRKPARVGRPSIYSQGLAEEICERLACGESLRQICEDDGMPDKSTVIRWLTRNQEFEAMHARARNLQVQVWVDEIVDLARSAPPRNPITGQTDWAAVQHIRNKVGTLQWILKKVMPKRRSWE